MADRLRVIAETDQNLAVNVTDGATLNQTGITRSSGAIDILGSAYTNNFPGTASTVLYGLDAVSDTLVVTAGPGGGIYTNVAPIGFGLTSTSNVGFDISGSTGMAFFNIEDALYSINLMPGTNNAANFIGTIGVGPLIGLTATTGAVPEPATWAMMITGFGIVGATARRRRRVASFV
ncbi:MAG: DUF4394 domain-containing protein, partial [Sphingomonadaceae bacterium]